MTKGISSNYGLNYAVPDKLGKNYHFGFDDNEKPNRHVYVEEVIAKPDVFEKFISEFTDKGDHVDLDFETLDPKHSLLVYYKAHSNTLTHAQVHRLYMYAVRHRPEGIEFSIPTNKRDYPLVLKPEDREQFKIVVDGGDDNVLRTFVNNKDVCWNLIN